MQTFQFQNSKSSLLLFLIIILFAITAASYTSNGATKTNEQYLITGKITDRKLIRGTNCPPAIIRTNENGKSGTMQTFIPKSFEKIDLIDYKVYRIEHRLVGERTFFSTNVPMSNIVVIVNYMADTKPDLKPCIVFAEPYSLPDDVIQNNSLQGATILQVEAIFKEGTRDGPRYDSLLRQYGGVTLPAQVTLKPEALEVSPGVLTAFVKLPNNYPVKNITSATCDGANADKMMMSDNQKEMIIKFRRQDIEEALVQIGQTIDTNFVVRGVWQDATRTNYFERITNYFDGTASIKKIVGANLSRTGREEKKK